MENNEIKPRVIVDRSHGSFNAMGILDAISIISAIIATIKVPIEIRKEYQTLEGPIGGITYGFIAWIWVTLILAIALRNTKINSLKIGQAAGFSILFGLLGFNILQVVNGIILSCSNVLVTVFETKPDKDKSLEEIAKEIKELEKNDVLKYQNSEAINRHKIEVSLRKDEIQNKIDVLNNLKKRNGLTREQEVELIKLHNDLDFCDEIISGEVKKDYNLEEILEAANNLPEDKKVLFENHKKFFDDGIYDEKEFIKKVSSLF